MSIRELARRSGINAGFLSRMEHGRMVPSSSEYHRVMAALASWRVERGPTSSDVEG